MKFDAVYSGISNEGRSPRGGGKMGRRINIFNEKNYFMCTNFKLGLIKGNSINYYDF